MARKHKPISDLESEAEERSFWGNRGLSEHLDWRQAKLDDMA